MDPRTSKQIAEVQGDLVHGDVADRLLPICRVEKHKALKAFIALTESKVT